MKKIIAVIGVAIVIVSLCVATAANASTIGRFFENSVPPHLFEDEHMILLAGGSETKYRIVVTPSETDPNVFIQKQYVGDTLLYTREFTYSPDGSYQIKETSNAYGETIFRISRLSRDVIRYEQIRLGTSEVFEFRITQRDAADRPMESEGEFGGMIIRTFAERNPAGKLISERVEWWDRTKILDTITWYFHDAGRVYKIEQ